MREATGFNLPAASFSILENSWRGSTYQQYQSVWKLWNHWCSDQLLDSTSISVSKLLGYLQSLVHRRFAWRTIGVHRSAISSILEPHKTVPVGQHPLVCCFMKGVFNVKPPTARVSPTWDVSRVLAMLAEWHPAMDIGFPALSKKVACLLAICSAKRVSDLTLFSVDKSLWVFFGDSSVVLQAHFGAKTDRPSHMSPPTRLKSVRTAACVQLVT